MAPRSPTDRVYKLLRDNLGSVRNVYLRGNRIVRHGDFAERPEAVLLLHGFFQTRNVWEVMEDRLRYDGFGVFSFDLGGLFWRFNTRSIGTLAHTIADKIEGICSRYGLDRFHIIGHSKGGIIARHYIQHHGGDRRAKSLITLGSPHHGTPTAAIGVGLMAGGLISRSPMEMLPGSSLMRMLKRDTFPAGIPLVSIYSRNDLVCPWARSMLLPRPGESSMQNRVVRGVGHTALTTDPGVYHLVRNSLDDAARIWRERSGEVDE
ncbi:MAG: alpha/beta fold hydrolase [Myxococcota bacterium]|nr:alpha/beta fold hydrolase [Myxococcota bacterium]